MQNNAVTLRSKKVELIYQELWGLLLAYNVVRREASQAAVSYGRAPNEIRFKSAYQYIAAQLIVMAAAQPVSRTGARLSELRAGVASLFMISRPRPSRPRTVKMPKTRYAVDRNAAEQHYAVSGLFSLFVAGYQVRNSARVRSFVLNIPPSAVVEVEEFTSITPRDFTQ